MFLQVQREAGRVDRHHEAQARDAAIDAEGSIHLAPEPGEPALIFLLDSDVANDDVAGFTQKAYAEFSSCVGCGAAVFFLLLCRILTITAPRPLPSTPPQIPSAGP